MRQNSTTYELADVGTRFFALVIDSIILGIVTGIVTSIFGNAGGILSFIVGCAYTWYFLTRQNGQTPGKSLLKIRVVKKDGSPIRDADAILRYVGYFINSFVIGLGWIWALFDSDRQGWHDKIASTYVVKV
jgi:uncharacterized RDD family membrane protein YckC